ncbi:SpaH/EbpB family LPXTG-anchored major pilin [Microbacterium hydrocarbonoxydans]|uniref:LPXTG-motif cell wall anchor domain-containing protein/fimbrial isopeptide formation D2 domain-containing protein n=1 Tax=Microbacterium hydrocarbonoxydans TaxID=273678 RepID=A0A1H4QCA4_9MICO|nr:SpaH/EbpB family LPXTG-anchored major pilin [Microbacterium hydrocarbonoxydans]SEC17275.1 LPXTG-motif cell wall anchor domain-containing protein/fimbrial isopeptide formation D2 domain-containing protein [Microbacterium hydrocarbonoxydans]
MNTPNTPRGSRVAAGLLVAGIAALTLAAPASAATPNLVDPDAVGSLTIHKYEAPETPTGLPNDGTEQNVALPPLAGVGFTVYKVDTIDLTGNQGWIDASDLADLNPDSVADITAAGYTASAVGGETLTDANGEIALANLDLGVYFVVETSPLAGSTGVAPFLVTVPLTDPANDDAWLYDVHVYPKNALTAATKTVEDSADIKLGDEIDFTITADIPNVAVIDGYKVVDTLDSKLDYVSAAVTLADGTALAATDYTITHDAATNAVTVEFTAAGLAVLAAHNSTEVQVVITAAVNEIGEIANTAVLYPNLGSFTITPGEPGGPTVTPEVITKWGDITVEKTDKAGAPLTGAVFSVYPTQQDAADGTNAIALGGATEFAVAADGTVTISGLRYSDWANNAAVAAGDAGYQTYWLAEIVAPDGFELLAEPIEFTVTAATTAVGVDLEVVNVPSNAGFKLPLTGGAGTTLFIAGGVLLLGGAVLLAIRSRRKAAIEA